MNVDPVTQKLDVAITNTKYVEVALELGNE